MPRSTPPVTLGIDLGTGSTKAALVDVRGRVVAEHAVAHPAGAEADAGAWWRSAVHAVRGVLLAASRDGGRGSRVRAVGLAGQMHGVVLVDRALNPLAPAVTWADTSSPETIAEVAELAAPYSRDLGNPVVAGMPAVTLRGLCRYRPRLLDEANLVLAPKDWLGTRLTGAAVTDPTDASATLLWDLPAGCWHWALLRALQLDAALLPEVVPSDGIRGRLLAAAADELGLPAGIPVTVGRGDTAAALLGSGAAGVPGGAQLTVGTGGQLCRVAAAPRPDPTGRTHLFSGPGPGQWYAMAATLSAGLTMEWVRGLFGLGWPRLYAEAFGGPAGAAGAVFLPYVAGERTPHLDRSLTAAWCGLGPDHRRPQLLRSALEGCAFALRDAWDALRAAGHDAAVLILAGGGTADPRWRQLLADVLDRPLAGTPHGAGSARGAALSAGLAAGFFGDLASAVATSGPPSVIAAPGAADYTASLARFRATPH